jgi:hypothetical protein
MVETSVKPQRRRGRLWLSYVLALIATGFMVVMALTGKLSETRQLAKFEARGVLSVPPEQVRQVELRLGAHTATFVRTPRGGWARSGSQEAVSDELSSHLDEAVSFMHTSGPVRVMQRDEYSGTPLQEFGLDQPRCTVVLSAGGRILLEASFGAYNPQDLLQYMQLKNRDNLYLMSRFVGQAWEHLGEHLRDAPSTP